MKVDESSSKTTDDNLEFSHNKSKCGLDRIGSGLIFLPEERHDKKNLRNLRILSVRVD